MDALTFEGLKTAALVILSLFGAVATLGKGLDVLHSWRKPREDRDTTTERQLSEHGQRLDAQEAQLGELRRMNQVQCVAMKALLSHEINGNSVDKLRLANDQLDAFLIGVGK